MKIRRMTHDDVEAISLLWLEMMREHETRDPRFELASGAPEKNFSDYLLDILGKQDAVVYVAEEEDRVVGYVLALILENPGIFELKRYGFIGEMSVSRDLRRQGVGHLLWERVRRWFVRKGVTVVQLNVSPKNRSGVAFWNALGFADFLEIKWCDLEKE